MSRKDIKKVVLAYSGGLDTSVILKWLQTAYGAEVITFTADLGQGEEIEPARKKAETLGIKPANIFIEDVREEFVRDYVFPMFRANAVYEGVYLLGTSIARPLIAKKQIEIAEKLGAECIQSVRQMLADLLGTFSVGRQRAPDGVDHVVPIGGKHRHAAARLGKLGEDVRPMRRRHGPDHVGLPGEVFRQRLALVARQIGAPLPHRLQGTGARLAPPPGSDSGTGNHNAMSVDLDGSAADPLRDQLPKERLRHRAAAGIAGADKEHHQTGQPAQRFLRDNAGMHHAKAGIIDRDCRCRLGIPGAAVVDHQTHGRPGRLAAGDHVQRRDRRRVVCPPGFSQHKGAGQHPHAVGEHRVARHPQPQFPRPDDQPSHALWQPMHEAVGMIVFHDDGHRSGPAPPRQPLAQRAQAGRPIKSFVGTFQRQRQPRLPGPLRRQAAELLRSRLVPGAGGDHVVGFRREGYRPALCQRLYRTMHDIAGIIGAAQINDHGRHGQGADVLEAMHPGVMLAGKTRKESGNMEKYRSSPGTVKHRHLGRTGEPWEFEASADSRKICRIDSGGHFSACDAVRGSGIPPQPAAAPSLIGTIDALAHAQHRNALAATGHVSGHGRGPAILRCSPTAAGVGVGFDLDGGAVGGGRLRPRVSDARRHHALAAACRPVGSRR